MKQHRTRCVAVTFSLLLPLAGQTARDGAYRLGPGDDIRVQQANAEDIDGRTAQIDDLGFASLPVVGRVHLGGLTLEEAEAAIGVRLGKVLLHPQPVVSIVEYRSQPVSVLGAVNNPGIVQLKGKKTLTEVIALAGGLRPEAGGQIRITRSVVGEPQEASASDSSAPAPMVTEVNVADVVNGSAKAASVLVLPRDTVTVPRAELVYVAGDVRKPGGFPLPASGGITVLQSVALAEGLGTEAAGKHAKIFRSQGDGAQKEEIPVDLSAILAGKAEDFQLKPRDILFVPNSASKHAGVRAAEAAIQAATGLVIWRR